MGSEILRCAQDDRAILPADLGQTQTHGRLHLTPIGMCKAAAYSKNTYLFAQSRVLAARCGKKKAMVAIGLSVLVIIYHVLSEK